MIGKTISHYRVLDEIGRGGMGQVYLAEDTKLGRQAALKFLPPHLAGDHVALERFVREARAASALNHPNICTIYEVDDSDRPFIAMELLAGTTLRARLTGTPLPPALVVSIGLQIADALDAAHTRGIIHRDIKPENISINDRDRVKLLDFGLAKMTRTGSNDTETRVMETMLVTGGGLVQGTVAYMSPEQARGEDLRGSTDLFSLGIVLYEMTTGTRPFGGTTTAVIFDNILNHAPPAPHEIAASVPAGLEQVLLKLLEKDPANRYATAAALIADLRELELDQASVQLEAMRTIRRAAPPTVTWRKRTVLAGVAAAVVMAGAAFAIREIYFSPPATVSIAVLPFANTDANAERQYVSDGVSTSVTNTLAQIGGLRVAPHASVARFPSETADPARAAKDLGVSVLLTGRVKQAGELLTIAVELTNVTAQRLVWGETYTRSERDLVEVQELIATAVAEHLVTNLSADDRKKLAKRPTSNPEAYKLYLQGHSMWDQWTESSLEASLEYYRQATLKDPGYALAYFGLANSYFGLAYLSRPPKTYMPLAKENLTKALALDDALPEAHYLLGIVNLYFDWDVAAARPHFARALALNPRYADAHFAVGNELVVQGKLAEARPEIEQSVALDPFSNTWNEQLTVFYSGLGDLDRAEEQGRKSLARDPSSFWLHADLGMILTKRGKPDAALALFEQADRLAGGNSYAIGYLGFGQARAGHRTEAMASLARLDAMAATKYVPSYARALVWAGLGDAGRAMSLLERARDERDFWLLWYFILDGAFDFLKPDPRYAALLAPLRATAAPR